AEVPTGSGDSTTTTAYQSAKAAVSVPVGGSASLDMALLQSSTVPAAASLTFDVSQLQTFTLSDGTQIIIPAGAFGSSGNATLQITPKTQIPISLENQPLTIAYSFTALDASGQPITQFNSAVSIVLHYDPAS